MFGHKQINLNAPYLYLTKRKGTETYDLFILLEVLNGAQVIFPPSQQLPDSFSELEINIKVIPADQPDSKQTEPKFQRYTIEGVDGPGEKKVVVRSLIEEIGRETFRKMVMHFKDSDEAETVTTEEVATDCPYLYLDISNGNHTGFHSQNGNSKTLAFTPNVAVPTLGGRVLDAMFNGRCTATSDTVESTLLFQPSRGGSEPLVLEKLILKTMYAETVAERTFSVELAWLEGIDSAAGDNEDEDPEKKKKAKTRHGNSSDDSDDDSEDQ